ncbi:MAG: agmatine deiminase family protein [Henriciella sp.]|nr:agmatine deiminase family protein [Henriciella sp.]
MLSFVAWAVAMDMRDIFVPPEWAEQAVLWVGWPHLREEWGAAFEGARAEIAGFIQAARAFVPVHVACGSPEAKRSAFAATGSHVFHSEVPSGDIWLRDTGPVIAEVDGQPGALIFAFNGWGGKYVMSGDTETAAAIAAQMRIPVHRHDFVLEGGAVELDGAGRLLTTRQCVLNPNRNPDWDEASAEAALKAAFGVVEVIWLERGLANDHTDGHIDNIARFVAPGHVLCQHASGEDDPNADLYGEIEERLRVAGLQVSTLPSPGLTGDAMPASHLNFTLTNGVLLMPAYEGRFSAEAMMVLAELFPRREVIALPARNILSGGGSFHCMTREIPRFPIATGEALP